MHEIHEYFEISPSVLQRQFYDSVVSVRIQGVVAPPSRRERDRSLAITFEYRFHFDAAAVEAESELSRTSIFKKGCVSSPSPMISQWLKRLSKV